MTATYSRDLTGLRFGKLLVVKRSGSRGKGSLWECRCECGIIKQIMRCNLVKAHTVSCGCHRRQRLTTHGMKNRPEYRIWLAMKNRCHNPAIATNPLYRDYGGRGIKVCERWRASFPDFLADMGPKPSPDHELDRIDNDGDYEPGNCRWATVTQQARNRRSNLLLTIDGETRCLAEWAEQYRMSQTCLYQRLKAGWNLKTALTTPNQREVQNQRRVAH